MTAPNKIIDSTIVKAHQHAMGAIGGKDFNKIGKSRGGWTTKIHAVVDSKARPLTVSLTEGQRDDSQMAIEMLKDHACDRIIGDKAYDTNAIRVFLKIHGGAAIIPSQSKRTHQIPYNQRSYKKRNLVERFFQRIKGWRRIATRYEKKGTSYLSIVIVACICFWLMY